MHVDVLWSGATATPRGLVLVAVDLADDDERRPVERIGPLVGHLDVDDADLGAARAVDRPDLRRTGQRTGVQEDVRRARRERVVGRRRDLDHPGIGDLVHDVLEGEAGARQVQVQRRVRAREEDGIVEPRRDRRSRTRPAAG